MYTIHDNLFIKQKLSEKEYQLSCAQGTFLVPDAEVLVYRKQDVQWMRTSQIGDGMEIILHFPKVAHPPLSVHAVEAWLSVYHEYDEERNERDAYLYKYGGGDYGRERIQNFLRSIGSVWEIFVERWFTRFRGFCINEIKTYTHLVDADFCEQFAFLIWLCIGYGKPKQIVNDRIMSRHVWLPIVWSIAYLYEYIDAVCARLWQEGIYMVRSLQMQRIGSFMQCTIHDNEVLDYIDTIRTGNNYATTRWAYVLNKIYTLLWAGDERLHNSVLKFISK